MGFLSASEVCASVPAIRPVTKAVAPAAWVPGDSEFVTETELRMDTR
jgi:hypothetical protein